MAEITFTAEITEYNVISPKEYENVSFCINDKSLVISFLDDNDLVLTQSEIEIKDAKILAKLINL